MVAISTLPTTVASPVPHRGRARNGASPLRAVGPRAAGPTRLQPGARLVVAALLAVVVALAVAHLVRAEPAPAAGSVPVLDTPHVVAEGETMWSIARTVAPAGEAAPYVERLVEANGTATVTAGEVLVLPVP